MMSKADVGFVEGQGAKNAHSHSYDSYVRLFVTQRFRKRYPGLAVIWGLT